MVKLDVIGRQLSPRSRAPIGFGFGTDFCSKVPNRKFGFGSGTDQYRTDRFRDFPKVPKSIIMCFLIFSYDYLGLREISLSHLRSPWVVRNQLEITLGCAKLAWVTWDYLGLLEISLGYLGCAKSAWNHLGLHEISLGQLRLPWVARN